MADASKPTDVTEEIKKWLATEGYPLEFRTADALQRHGFNVEQGLYVSDPITDKLREIDLFAMHGAQSNGLSTFQLTMLVECKWSADRPWVAFSSQSAVRNRESNIYAAMATSCHLGEAALWTAARLPALRDTLLLTSGERAPFAVRRAFKDGSDQCYAAVQGVVGATRVAVKNMRAGQPDFLAQLGSMWMIRPLIVTNAALFEAFLAPNGGELELKSRDWIRLAWHGAQFGAPYSIVDIVTDAKLDNYLTSIVDSLPSFLQALQQGHLAVKEALRNESLYPISQLRGEESHTYLPTFLSALGAK